MLCAVPENVHAHTKEGQHQKGEGVFQRLKTSMENMKLHVNWNSQRGGEFKLIKLLCEGYGLLLEQDNPVTCLKAIL